MSADETFLLVDTTYRASTALLSVSIRMETPKEEFIILRMHEALQRLMKMFSGLVCHALYGSFSARIQPGWLTDCKRWFRVDAMTVGQSFAFEQYVRCCKAMLVRLREYLEQLQRSNGHTSEIFKALVEVQRIKDKLSSLMPLLRMRYNHRRALSTLLVAHNAGYGAFRRLPLSLLLKIFSYFDQVPFLMSDTSPPISPIRSLSAEMDITSKSTTAMPETPSLGRRPAKKSKTNKET